MIESMDHVLAVGPIGSRGGYTTFFKDAKDGIGVMCGCFAGSLEEFLEKVSQTHGNTKHAAVYRAAAELAKAKLGLGVKEMREEKKNASSSI